MKTTKSSALTIPFLLGLALFAVVGCASNKTENISRLGTQSTFDITAPGVHRLGTYYGSSTGGKLFFLGGSPGQKTAERRAEEAATADAIKKGIDPSCLRFVNPDVSESGVPLLVVNFKTKTASVDAYWIENAGNKVSAAPTTLASTPSK